MYQTRGTPSAKVVQIEEALRRHNDEKLRELAWSSGEETDVAHGLLPSIDDEDQKFDFKKTLARSMRQIRGYNKLCDEVRIVIVFRTDMILINFLGGNSTFNTI